MANTVGLIALANGMRQYLFYAGQVGISVTTVGWRQRPQILNQGVGQANRIVLYPGKEPGGAAGVGGNLTRENRPSTNNPRALITWRKDVTMSVWAVDTADTNNEELQIAAVETLLELAVQAAHNAIDPDTGRNVGLAAIEWGAARYTIPPAEMRFGNEILVEFVHKCPLFDAPIDVCFPQFAVARSLESGPIVNPFTTDVRDVPGG